MKETLLRLLRFIPIFAALCCALDSILSYYYIDVTWFGYIIRALFVTAWLMLAIYFRFCIFYFILVAYILVCSLLNTIDYIWTIPLSDKGLFVFHCGLAGITFITATIAHVRDKGKHKNDT